MAFFKNLHFGKSLFPVRFSIGPLLVDSGPCLVKLSPIYNRNVRKKGGVNVAPLCEGGWCERGLTLL